MRQDNPIFAVLNESAEKEPRFVIKIEFETDSIYLTSHSGITGIPGVLIENVLEDVASISQRIIPDEGRTEIGSFSFQLIDKDSAFTQAIQERLADFQGLRDHRVRFYVGYANPGRLGEGGFGTGTFGSEGYGEGIEETLPDASFDEFQLFQTQDITGVKYRDGIYSVQCADITREQRKDIFEPKRTTLRDSITAAATTIPVYVTTSFTPIQHGASFSDAPNSFVGYLMIEDEIIRYTGKTADSFTGCTRGVFNTKAVPHEVDANTVADRRTKVEEMIYLEMPAPMMSYALLTGIMKQPSGDFGLPSHWHLGITPDLVRLTDFTGIGEDLWNPADDTLGFMPAFQELKKTDGKKFIETELYQLIGCYGHVYYDGQLGLKRMNPVLIDASGVVELNESNVVDWSDLAHDYKRLHNAIRVDWNWNGEEFTRTTLFVDTVSIETHEQAPLKTLKFKGLRGWRHSDGVIRAQIGVFRDRYTAPPETLSITVLPSLNRLEVGDIVRVKLANVRDFAGNVVPIDRAFEIQKKSDDYSSGKVTLDLFGSTGRASADEGNAGTEAVLPDEWYASQGAALSSVATIVEAGGVGTVQAGSYNLTGHTNLNNPSAIYYHEGDLTIANGATLVIEHNVQLRVSGFLTVNGLIDGIGNGRAGTSDPRTPGDPAREELQTVPLGNPGYVGNSRGMDGVQVNHDNNKLATIPCGLTQGTHASFPLIALEVVEGVLKGLPNDLRGTGGGPGGPVCRRTFVTRGGAGAASGAGLAIICRGLAFGASGEIDLSGADSAATSLVSTSGIPDVYPGAGGAGGPGALFIGLDGGDVSIPDVGGKFFAVTGAVPISGNPIQKREMHKQTAVKRPYSGFLDAALISEGDYSNAAHRIQYIPAVEDPAEDENDIPAAPTGLTVTGTLGANSISVAVPALLPNDVIEIYGSATNDRTDAVLVASGDLDLISRARTTGTLEYYWARIRRVVDGPDVFSDWYPASATAGVSSSPRTVDTPDIEDGAVTAILSATANEVEIVETQHTPEGQGFNTLVTSLSYTPDITGEVLVTVSGYADYTFDAAGTFLDLQYSLQEDSSYDGFQEQHWFFSDPVAGAQYFNNISLSRRFALTSGVAKTFKFMAAKFQAADDVFMRNVELRLEAIKK